MPRADQDTLSLPRPGGASQANPEAVARRAYELYQQRGGKPGHEIEDWLQAEAELAARAQVAPAADIGTRLEDRLDDRLEDRQDDRPAPAPASSPGSSAATSRKGNSSRRSQRQPQSH